MATPKLDFVVDPSERERLTDRINEIETILTEIGFYISDLGEVTSEYKPKPISWKAGLAAVILFITGHKWLIAVGFIFLMVALDGPIAELTYRRRIEPHRLKLKELELELARIRQQLFGSWANWRLDKSKLDDAVLSALELGKVYFPTDINGKLLNEFSVIVSPKTYKYSPDHGQVDAFVDAGTADLEIEGKLRPAPENPYNDVLKKPYVFAKLRFHSGEHDREYIVISLADTVKAYFFGSPEELLPKSWSRLQEMYVFESEKNTKQTI